MRSSALPTRYARYFVPQSGVEKIIINMVDNHHGMRDTVVRVTGLGMPD